MSEIEFTKQEKEVIVRKIQSYFQDKLEQEIGRFDAEFLFGFFTEVVGPYYYNRGLYDTLALIEKKLERIGEDLTDTAFQIEKPTEFSR